MKLGRNRKHFSRNLSVCIALSVGLVLFLILLGCGAYFNTYYNAKKFFSQAEKKRIDQEKRDLVSGNTNAKKVKIPEYTKAIEKGSKVLQFHPKSKYVDDALMLIGQSFYHTFDYLKARRKFEELISIFPNSELASEANLWLGMTLIELKEYESALTVLNKLVSQDVNKRLSGEARIMLGELYFARDDYPAAINEFTKTINNVSDKSRKIRALFRSGEAYLELQDYSNAAQVFRRALDFKPELEQKYTVELAYAKTLRLLKEYDQSLLVFDKMTKGAITKNEMANVRLEIAYTYIEKKDWDKAKITFEEIVVDYKNSEFSIQASYELGKMSIKKNDLLQAIDFFEAAGKIKKRSTISDSVKFWLDNVKEWDKLVFEIAVLENAYYSYNFVSTDTVGEYVVEEPDVLDGFTMRETLAFNKDQEIPDSLQTNASNDTTQSGMEKFLADQLLNEAKNNANSDKSDSKVINSNKTLSNRNSTQPKAKKEKNKTISVPKSFNQLETKFVSTHSKLAELFLFQLEQPDSALNHYAFLSQHFDDNKQVPQWQFMLSSLQRNRGNKKLSDSLFQEIISKYPETAYASEARKILGQKEQEKQIDPAELLFIQAENQLFVKNDVEASLILYNRIWVEYKDSDIAPKAIYAMAWIAERKQFDNEEATKIYEQLITSYPNSEQASKVKIILNAVKVAKQEQEKQLERETRELAAKAAADSLALIASESDSLALKSTATDSLAEMSNKSGKPKLMDFEAREALREEILLKSLSKDNKKQPAKPKTDPRKMKKATQDSTKTKK